MKLKLKIFVTIALVVCVVYLYNILKLKFELPKGNVIKIGYFAPMTGPAAETSKDMIDAFRLANQLKGKLAKTEIQAVYEDDSCDPKKAVSAAKKLIEVDKVDILVAGVCSGSVLSTAPIAESSKVVLLTPIASSPKISNAGDYVFRISGSASKTAVNISDEIISKLNIKKVGIIYENTDYVLGWRDSFLSTYIQKGGAVTASEGFNTKDTDLRAQLLKIKSSNPVALVALVNSASSVNTVLNQMHELGMSIPVIGNEYFAFKQSIVNSYTEGQYATVYEYDTESPLAVSFRKTFVDTYKRLPDVEVYSALTFDAYNLIYNAINQCDSQRSILRECIKDKLYGTKDYQGVTGSISIDANGDAIRNSVLKKIVGGRLVDF